MAFGFAHLCGGKRKPSVLQHCCDARALQRHRENHTVEQALGLLARRGAPQRCPLRLEGKGTGKHLGHEGCRSLFSVRGFPVEGWPTAQHEEEEAAQAVHVGRWCKKAALIVGKMTLPAMRAWS